MWKNTVERGKPQMTIWRMRIVRFIPKATNTHSECAILMAFLLQKWLQERAWMLPYAYITCLVHFPAHIDWEDQIINDVVGGTCSMLLEKRNTC